MKLISFLAAILIAGLGSCSVKAQINVVPVNGGTGSLVTIPINGANGLSVTVGQGSAALPLQNLATDPAATRVYIGDDDNRNVPLPFTFPFFGQSFNNSWMHSNGVVSFQNPNLTGGFCCSGEDLRTTTWPGYNYAIMAMWTDLININGSHYYKTTPTSATYGWYNVSEYYNPSSQNSFEIDINNLGVVNTRIAKAMISNHPVTSGMTGDLSKGEYFQYYHGYGWNIPSGSGVSWSALNGTGGGNICFSNPLSDPSCPGYYDAYRTQQCTISALYDPSCPGYSQAFHDQQCTADPLYASDCPGYTQAYHDQQCSINPLFATDCNGYQQAYHDQQCSINPLSYTDCPGYASAYLNQQCSINPLYSTTCSGYQQAYFNQQCQISGLYSTQCPNYATAYATQQALQQSQQSTTTTTTTTSTSSTTTTSTPTTSSDGSVSVPVVKDSNVNTVITTTATSASPAQAATATVPLVQAPAATETKAMVATVETKQEKTEEKKSNESSPSNNSTTTASTGNTSSDSKSSDQPKTARQELQEKREAAAKAKAVETGKNLANEMGKSASMDRQVEVQNVVIQAMGYSPAFEAYKFRMPDGVNYRPYSIYTGQKTVDNRSARRMFGGTDQLHDEMVNSQYK